MQLLNILVENLTGDSNKIFNEVKYLLTNKQISFNIDLKLKRGW